jgi:hypothetical protein
MQVIRATSTGAWEGWGGKEPIAVETDGETPGLSPTPKVLYVGLYMHVHICITYGETLGLSPCLALLSRPRPHPHFVPPPPFVVKKTCLSVRHFLSLARAHTHAVVRLMTTPFLELRPHSLSFPSPPPPPVYRELLCFSQGDCWRQSPKI